MLWLDGIHDFDDFDDCNYFQDIDVFDACDDRDDFEIFVDCNDFDDFDIWTEPVTNKVVRVFATSAFWRCSAEQHEII